MGYPPRTRDVGICANAYQANHLLKQYVGLYEPSEGAWGEDQLTYRVVEEDGQFVVRGYNQAALEGLSDG